jgi:hypothetical protein
VDYSGASQARSGPSRRHVPEAGAEAKEVGALPAAASVSFICVELDFGVPSPWPSLCAARVRWRLNLNYQVIVFDKFHVMVLAGEALDQVRRELQREGADLKGAMWSLRGNTWNLSEDRQEQRKNLCRQYTQLGRALSLRETLQAIYANSDRQVAEVELHWWCGWAARSRLSPFRDLAKTVPKHWERILAYFDTRLTSAASWMTPFTASMTHRKQRRSRIPPTQSTIIASIDQNSILPGNGSQIQLDHCRFYGRRSVIACRGSRTTYRRIAARPPRLTAYRKLRRTIIYCTC